MMKKIKIAFLSPETKGGPYYVYKEIVDYFTENYSEEIEVYFYHSKGDWIKLHFRKYDYVFSVIPFLFKPLQTQKYIFNPRGNFEIEKKKNNLGNKLLYLARYNLNLCDNIWLTSYFLADKLNFKEQYKNKIIIIPNFIDKKKYFLGEKKYNEDVFNILTITSFKFFDKGKGILDLGDVISKLGAQTTKKIHWTIVGADSSLENFKIIKKNFDKIIFGKNINITWKGWLDKDKLKTELKNNDYFIYWTYLDTFGNVILDAIGNNMKVLINNYEAFNYIFDRDIICDSTRDMSKKLLLNNIKITTIKNFEKDVIMGKLFSLINENYIRLGKKKNIIKIDH